MKKLIACCLLLFLIVGGGCLSYSISKKHAEAVKDDYQRDYHLSISPLKGHLMLGIDGKFSHVGWAQRFRAHRFSLTCCVLVGTETLCPPYMTIQHPSVYRVASTATAKRS
jgi:hypothetical protein